MVPYLRAANVKDGSLELSDVKEMNFDPSEQSVFSLRAGDILVTEGSGSLAAIGASAVWNGEISGVVCFQNTLLRLRPRDGVSDGRFVAWLARALYASGQFSSIASGANIYHLSADRLKGLPAELPSLEEQRRIADYLDATAKRTDDLFSARRRMKNLLSLKRQRMVEQVLGLTSELPTVPLKFAVGAVGVGIVITPARWYVDSGGVPALRGLNVQPGGIDVSNLVHISQEGHAENIRSRLSAGDVVVVRTGQAGAAALIPTDLDGCN